MESNMGTMTIAPNQYHTMKSLNTFNINFKVKSHAFVRLQDCDIIAVMLSQTSSDTTERNFTNRAMLHPKMA